MAIIGNIPYFQTNPHGSEKKKKTCPNGISWMAPIRYSRTDCSPIPNFCVQSSRWRSGVDSPMKNGAKTQEVWRQVCILCIPFQCFYPPSPDDHTIWHGCFLMFNAPKSIPKATPCNPQKDEKQVDLCRSHLNSAGFSISFRGFNGFTSDVRTSRFASGPFVQPVPWRCQIW